MMKKTRIMLAVLAAVVAMTFAGCEAVEAAFKDALYSINGKVVNTKSASDGNFYETKDGLQSLAGTSVVFTSLTGATYTATVGSSGTYSIADVPNGSYTITASKTGWAFIPKTSFVVTSSTLRAPDVLGFANSEAGALTVALQWDNTTTDMDLHMTYGTLSAGTSSNHLYYDTDVGVDTLSGTNFTATLDRDVTGSNLTSGNPLVETITLTATGGAIAPSDATNYDDADLVDIDSTFRFYIDAFGKPSGTTGNSPSVQGAGATVHVFQGSNHLGSYFAPFNTAERTIRVLKVAFDGTSTNNYFAYTDIVSTTANTYRSLGLPQIGLPVSAIE